MPRWRRLEAVLFDLDETLTDESMAIETALAATLALAGERYGTHARQLQGNLKRLFLHTLDRPLPHWLLISAQPEHWHTVLEMSGIDDAALAQTMASHFQECFLERVRLFPDVHPALRAVGARYALGLIVNGEALIRRTQVQRLGLSDYFETLVISGEYTMAKPEPQLCKQAFAALGCRAGETLHVGDDPLEDVLGAKATGIYACWLNRRGLSFPEDMPPPNIEVRDLHELARPLRHRRVRHRPCSMTC